MSHGAVDEERLTAALRAAGARFAYLFGSRVEGVPRPDSDLDVAGFFGAAPPASWDVDLPGAVDLVVLDTAPLYLAGRIALRGRLLFDDDPPTRVAWEADIRTVYLDELPYVQAMAKDYLDGLAADGRR